MNPQLNNSGWLDELMERLASIEHERWADWQKWVHGMLVVNGNGEYTLPTDAIRRWDRQIETPYAELSEQEKQSDRDQVMRYWPIIQAYITNQRQANVKKNKSLCGCPMCDFHTSAAQLQPKEGENEDT